MNRRAITIVEAWLLAFALTACLAASVIAQNGVTFVVTLAAAAALAVYFKGPAGEREFLAAVFVSAFIARVGLMYLLHWQSVGEGFGGFLSGDDRLYSIKALKMALAWQHLPFNALSDLGGAHYGLNIFTYLLAGFYRFFEPVYFDSKLVNCLIGAMVPIAVWGLSRMMTDRRAARVACCVAAFYPSLIRWSVCNLRDPLTALFLVVIVALLVRAVNGGRMTAGKIAGIAVAGGLLSLMRYLQILTAYGLAGAIAVFIVYRLALPVFRRKAAAVAAGVILIAYAAAAYQAARPAILRQLNVIVYRNEALAASDTAGYRIYDAQVLKEIDAGVLNPVSLGRVYLKGVAYFIGSPFPWAITTLNQAAAYPQMLLWYLLLILAAVGVPRVYAVSPHGAVLVMLYLFLGITMWSVAEGNIGAAFRHRDYFSPLIFIFSAAGAVRWYDRSAGRKGGRR